MLIFLGIIGVIVLCFIFPLIPFLVTHLYQICVWGVIDLYYYFKHKRWNECLYYGQVWITTAYRNKVFGSGKTLDITMMVRNIYKHYNNLQVWDPDLQKYVTQHINVISNVDFDPEYGIPYKKFISASQLKTVEQGSMDVTIFLFDEIGAIWNSRNYKDNISTELLKHLLQCRKNKIMIIGSSQRFHFVDALLRQITGSVFCVKKTWRILKKQEYDPFELENCTNMDMIKPVRTLYKFIYDKDYAAYDTRAKVDDLLKLDLLPDQEILANQHLQEGELAAATGLKRRYRKRVRK